MTDESTMVERVAQVISEAMFGFWDGDEKHIPTSPAGQAMQAVRAAIAAMREPTVWRIDTAEGKAIMALRKPAYVAVCRQTNCSGRGFDPEDSGCCAWCADIADDVIETHSRSICDAALAEKP